VTTTPSAPYFDRVASQWDALRSGYFSDEVRQHAIQKAYLHPSLVVADVGAGSGFMTVGLAPLVHKVHVIDSSPAMLEVARQNLAHFDNLEFHQADLLALPLPDASLDTVFANMVLHHCPDPLAAIRELVRVLRPAGRLVITDLEPHSQAWLQAEMADLWLGFSRAQIRQWFAQASLVNTIVDCTGQSCQAASQQQAGERAAIRIFLATGTRRVEARDYVQASYAARALGAESCCSSTSCSCSDVNCCSPGELSPEDEEAGAVQLNPGYSAAEKASIPQEAAEISLGCGNPIAMANLRPGEVVLDIGSGGGMDAFLAARRVGPEGEVIGVDMTPAMLQRARRAAKKGGFTNIRFRHGYAERLPLPDDSVDVVLSNCVINLAEDKARVFREAFRVLKPGGRLEVSDIVFGGAVPPLVRTSLYGWAECVSGALPEPEYLDLVRQAGFREISVRRSASAGSSAGVPVYSAQVSARK